MLDGWVADIFTYTDHSLNYGQLVEDVMEYVDADGPDADVFKIIAAYIDETLTKAEKKVSGVDALLPAVVLILQAINGQDEELADQHKKIINKLLKGA